MSEESEHAEEGELVIPLAPNTLPENLPINIIGLDAELETPLREIVDTMLLLNGRTFNLAGLDGLTFATDYQQALLDLDRGYDTKFKLTPSNNYGVGVAMSPLVLRDSSLKSHIVVNAQAFLGMLSDKRSDMAINLVAHECAHVELNHLYDAAFPGVLLRQKANTLDHFRRECVLACWGEFGACWLSAPIGPTEVGTYESPFLEALKETRSRANTAIREYRTNSDLGSVLNVVCDLYHNLLKYSAYHLGNLHGLGLDWRTVPTTALPLQDHWFLPFFERLDGACKSLAADHGNWAGSSPFDALGDIAQDLVADGGLHFGRHEDDRISLDIPFTIETMPVPPHLWR